SIVPRRGSLRRPSCNRAVGSATSDGVVFRSSPDGPGLVVSGGRGACANQAAQRQLRRPSGMQPPARAWVSGADGLRPAPRERLALELGSVRGCEHAVHRLHVDPSSPALDRSRGTVWPERERDIGRDAHGGAAVLPMLGASCRVGYEAASLSALTRATMASSTATAASSRADAAKSMASRALSSADFARCCARLRSSSAIRSSIRSRRRATCSFQLCWTLAQSSFASPERSLVLAGSWPACSSDELLAS